MFVSYKSTVHPRWNAWWIGRHPGPWIKGFWCLEKHWIDDDVVIFLSEFLPISAICFEFCIVLTYFNYDSVLISLFYFLVFLSLSVQNPDSILEILFRQFSLRLWNQKSSSLLDCNLVNKSKGSESSDVVLSPDSCLEVWQERITWTNAARLHSLETSSWWTSRHPC